MKYCKECLYPQNHPLGITFDNDGVCSGCKIHKEKFTLDWEKRFKKLKKITASYKDKSLSGYDCIIPVSGAKDSYFTVYVVTKLLGLNPLLVRYNPHYNSHVGNRNYAYLKTLFDVDAIDMVVQPQKVKRITRTTLDKLHSIHWHVIAGQSVFPVQVAVRYKIPLIIWGAHQGVEQVGMYSHEDEVEMTRKYRKEHDLMGIEAEDLVGVNGLSTSDLLSFFYPDSKEIEKVGVRGIYLSNYISWDSKAQHELMIEKYNYETALQNRTFDTYNTIDTLHYADIHDAIKVTKCGYGIATDHATREIRWKRITRQEGELLAQYFQSKPLQYDQIFTQWLQVDKTTPINNILFNYNTQRSPINQDIATILQKLNFILTPPKEQTKDESFTLLEKGFVNNLT